MPRGDCSTGDEAGQHFGPRVPVFRDPTAATGSPRVSPLSVLPAAKKPSNLKSAGDTIRKSRLGVKKEPESKERGEL